MNLNNNTSKGESMNGKMNDLGMKAKDFINEEKVALNNFGSKAYEEVQTLTADVLKEVKTQVNDIASDSLSLIRKNPVIAIAAAVTVGLIIAKMVSKPHSDSKQLNH